MPLIAFDVNETHDYILQQERDQQNTDPAYQPTVFELGLLDSALSATLFDSSMAFHPSDKGPDADAEVKVNITLRRREIVRFGVRGWTNLLDRAGNPIAPVFQSFTPIQRGKPRRGLADQSLDHIKPWLQELAAAIEADNILTEAQEKN